MQWAETTPPKPKSKGRFEPPGVWESKSFWWASRTWSGGSLRQHEGYRDLPIEIVHASERVTMEESAGRAFESKRDSSLRVASRLVRDGRPPDSCRRAIPAR